MYFEKLTDMDNISTKKIAFICQITIIFTIIIAAILNISFNRPNQGIWISLLSGCIGYIIPAPSMQLKNKQLATNNAGI